MQPCHTDTRTPRRRLVLTWALAVLFAAVPMALPLAQNSGGPNYQLAAQWTAEKVGRMVFDTTVTPRWFETGDRFWYTYQTNEGRRFYLVDPAKKTKAPLFDHARMAATLMGITGIPYDEQHLPFSTVRFVKDDTAFEFDVQVPRDSVILKPVKKPATTEAAGVAAGEQQRQQGQERQQRQQQQQQQQTQQQNQQQNQQQQRQQQRGRGGQQGQRGTGAAPPARPRTLHFEYTLATGTVDLLDDDYRAPRPPRWASVSPDKNTVIFARNHNLYMMDKASYELAQKNANDPKIVEVQLTKDGEEHYSYARTQTAGTQIEQQDEQQGETEQAGDEKNARVPPVTIIWSKDSRKFSLIRRDERKVNDLWVINALAEPRPKLETYRYAMPGEPDIPQPEILLFDRETKAMAKVKADRFKDQSLSIATAPRAGRRGGPGGDDEAWDEEDMAGDPQQRGLGGADQPPPQWLSEANDKLYFLRSSRDLHRVDVCVADPETGDVKVLIEERLNTYIETKPLRLVNDGKDLIFWSERTGWGHFYLYDATTGALKNAITSGEFVTTSLEGVDEPAAPARGRSAGARPVPVMFFTAAGREPDEDPYYPHLYRVNLDGTGLKLLNPGDANHAANLSESTRYFVDNATRVDGAAASALYDGEGTLVAKLETPDFGALEEAGFRFPEPFKVKADDGITDLYGVMYKPFDFDPSRKYPIILYVYPGPQTESVTKNLNPRSVNISLAQFGFIVIEVGNRGGNPNRSKWYHNYGYGNLRDYGLADKKAAVEQLARRHPFIDLTRVGIWGHSGGGFMTAAAMLVYPDFFKVGVSESGNHENNIYNNTWSEKHHGIKEVTDKEGNVTFEYNIEKNSELAKNLKGHILLVTGDIDNNVHPSNTYRLADAFIKANKRFDMLVIPGARHSYGAAAAYFNWIRADYFCRYLLGQAADSVDIVELNREREQTGERRQR